MVTLKHKNIGKDKARELPGIRNYTFIYLTKSLISTENKIKIKIQTVYLKSYLSPKNKQIMKILKETKKRKKKKYTEIKGTTFSYIFFISASFLKNQKNEVFVKVETLIKLKE